MAQNKLDGHAVCSLVTWVGATQMVVTNSSKFSAPMEPLWILPLNQKKNTNDGI